MACGLIGALVLACQANAATVQEVPAAPPRAATVSEAVTKPGGAAKADQPAVIECRKYTSPFEGGIGMDRPAQDLLDVQSGGALRPGGSNCAPSETGNSRP